MINGQLLCRVRVGVTLSFKLKEESVLGCDKGVQVGLFRPITLWPFPIDALLPVIHRARRIVVVEASSGQLEDEVRLALSHADVLAPPISHVRRQGGILPSQAEIVEHVLGLGGVN